MSMHSCARCVMPETAESLSFDDRGVCSVCRQIEVKQNVIDWTDRRVELDRIAASVRGVGDYDCIVPFSGGKDSTFTLWYVVKELKLRPLVVRFDHGFLRPTVIDNSLKTFRLLGVDVQHFTPNWQVVRKLMFESLRRRGDFCWHCHTGIYSYPMWVSIWQSIPLIIWGEPSAEYASFYKYDEIEVHDEERYNLIINLGINPEDMAGMLDDTISDYPVTVRDLKPYTMPSMQLLKDKQVRQMFLGNYIPWDVKKQVDIIKKDLDWKGDQVEGVPPEYDYEKIECFMQGVRDYIKYLKRGFGRTAHLASIDIRNGRLSREEGARLVAAYDGRRPPSLDLFLDFLGIDEKRFMEVVEPHVVHPHEMPTLEEARASAQNWRTWDYDLWSRSGREAVKGD